MQPTYKVSKVVLAPVNKRWWQFWRRKRTLRDGEHYIVKDTGVDIDFKKPVLSKKDHCEVLVFFDNVRLIEI